MHCFCRDLFHCKVYDLLVANDKRDFSREFFDAVSYSIFNLGLLIWLIVPFLYLGWYKNPWILFLIAFIVIVAGPVIWPVLYYNLIEKNEKISKWFVSPVKKPWDWFFAQRTPGWVVIHLRDGRKVGGIFAENSYASSHTASEQIYLEQVWQIDESEDFKAPIPRSNGVIILGKDIILIEFFN